MADRVLVLGGAGFIGSHVCKALHAAGYAPVTFDNLSSGHAWAVRWGPLERANITDAARLDAVLAAHQPVAAIHLAGLIAAGESVVKPDEYYWNNVVGMHCLLRMLRRHSVKKFVFSSSAAVYGNAGRTLIDEDCPCLPINPYGATKHVGERLLADFATAYGMDTVSLRYFNAAGSDPDGEIGEAHEPETHLIPLVLEAAAGRRAAIRIFGTDYPTPDGTCIRDYVHVSDLAQAHVLALQALERLTGSHAFNLGNGSGFSVQQIIAAARTVTGCDIPVEVAPARAGDPPVLVADARRARSMLGWTPRYSRLEQQIAHAWRWHMHYWRLYRPLPLAAAE